MLFAFLVGGTVAVIVFIGFLQSLGGGEGGGFSVGGFISNTTSGIADALGSDSATSTPSTIPTETSPTEEIVY